jgi:hypothetical protein
MHIPSEAHKAFKQHCAGLDVPMKEVLLRFIREGIKRDNNKVVSDDSEQ